MTTSFGRREFFGKFFLTTGSTALAAGTMAILPTQESPQGEIHYHLHVHDPMPTPSLAGDFRLMKAMAQADSEGQIRATALSFSQPGRAEDQP